MFRFTIRELVLLTVILATFTAWGIDHWRMSFLADICARESQLRDASERNYSRLITSLNKNLPGWEAKIAP